MADDDAADADKQQQQQQQQSRDHGALVNRLVEYTFRILNTEMEPFFTEHAPAFDQEGDDLRDRGETLEQYTAFQAYEKELEQHMDAFVKDEGFGSVAECFQTINTAVKEDLAAQETRMKALMEHIRKVQQQWMTARQAPAIKAESKGGGDAAADGDAKGGAAKAGGVLDGDTPAEGGAKAEAKGDAAPGGGGAGGGDAAAEGKGGDDEAKGGAAGKDDEEEEEVETTGVVTAPEVDLSPMMMFYQPITLEQLVQTVLSVGEYQTFSMMMRMKVRQLQMVRKLRAERRKELKHKRARRALLRQLADDGEEEAVTSGRRLEAALERLWAELAERVAELTPHRADLREAVGQRCASRMLTAWLDAGDRLLDRELDEEEEEEARATEGDGGSGGSGGGNTVTTTGNTGWFVGNGWGGGALGEGEDPAGSPAEGAAGQRRAVLKWIRFVFGRLAALCSWGQSVQVRARQAALEVPWKPLSGDGSTGGDDEPATSLPATLLQVRSSSLSLLPYIAPFLLVLLLTFDSLTPLIFLLLPPAPRPTRCRCCAPRTSRSTVSRRRCSHRSRRTTAAASRRWTTTRRARRRRRRRRRGRGRGGAGGAGGRAQRRRRRRAGTRAGRRRRRAPSQAGRRSEVMVAELELLDLVQEYKAFGLYAY